MIVLLEYILGAIMGVIAGLTSDENAMHLGVCLLLLVALICGPAGAFYACVLIGRRKERKL